MRYMYMTACVANVTLERVQKGASVYSKRFVRNASRPLMSIHDGFAVRKLNQKLILIPTLANLAIQNSDKGNLKLRHR